MGAIKKYILAILLSIIFCNENAYSQIDIDSSRYTVITLSKSFKDPTFIDCNPVELSDSMIIFCLGKLKYLIEEYNNSPQAKRLGKIDYTNYTIQLMGFQKDKTNRVYINAICLDYAFQDNLWKEELLLFNDGGNCFFHTIVDLDSKDVISFYVNGR